MRIALIVVSIALVASVAAGLTGLWPNLRHSSSASDRRERVQIAAAVDKDILNANWHVSRMKLDYLPGKALVEAVPTGHSNSVGECAVVTENFGHHVEKREIRKAACDF